MLNRASGVHAFHPADSDPARALVQSIRLGTEAIKDPEIEAKVRHYFEAHPAYSRDLIHVAAVATRFQSEKAQATVEPPKPTRMLPSLT